MENMKTIKNVFDSFEYQNIYYIKYIFFPFFVDLSGIIYIFKTLNNPKLWI